MYYRYNNKPGDHVECILQINVLITTSVLHFFNEIIFNYTRHSSLIL